LEHTETSGMAPVSGHTAVTFALQASDRLAKLLTSIKRHSHVHHAVGVVNRLAVDDRLFVRHEHLLLTTTFVRPHAQLCIRQQPTCIFNDQSGTMTAELTGTNTIHTACMY